MDLGAAAGFHVLQHGADVGGGLVGEREHERLEPTRGKAQRDVDDALEFGQRADDERGFGEEEAHDAPEAEVVDDLAVFALVECGEWVDDGVDGKFF